MVWNWEVIFSRLDGLTVITGILVIITIWYAYSTHRILKEQRKSSKISYIERRLEKLYLPLKDVLENPFITYRIDDTFEEVEWKKVENVIPFQYLAYEESKDSINEFIDKIITYKRNGTLSFKNVENDDIKGIIEKDIEKFKAELNELIG